jgi:hypothetical protein
MGKRRYTCRLYICGYLCAGTTIGASGVYMHGASVRQPNPLVADVQEVGVGRERVATGQHPSVTSVSLCEWRPVVVIVVPAGAK